jgi:hypothetical protein
MKRAKKKKTYVKRQMTSTYEARDAASLAGRQRHCVHGEFGKAVLNAGERADNGGVWRDALQRAVRQLHLLIQQQSHRRRAYHVSNSYLHNNNSYNCELFNYYY